MSDLEVSQDSHGIAVITINRPAKRNAVNFAMWRELGEICRKLAADRAVRAVILTGGGGHFSAGADISEFSDLAADPARSHEYDDVARASIEALKSMPKPTVAAVSGFCLGGGTGLALACDFRVADETSVFGIPAARLGIFYEVQDTRDVVNTVGMANAKRILFSAARFKVAQAQAMGLVDERCTGDSVTAARELLAPMIENAPLSIAGAKRTIMALSEQASPEQLANLDELRATAKASADYREGVAAFAAKRPPQFQGI